MADIGYNSTFGIYNGVSYVNVGEVFAITPPGYARDAIETTHMTSANRYREFIAGLLDAGEASIEYNYTPAAAEVVYTAMQSNSLGSFRITHPNGVTLTFSAVVTAWTPGIPMDDRMTGTATFKISGRPVWA